MSKTATSRKMLRPMTPEAVEVAARADRDAQPLPPADLKRMKRTPQAKIIRRALALTQKNFLSATTFLWALSGTGSKVARNRTNQRKPISRSLRAITSASSGS
jgi:hypothetical protein